MILDRGVATCRHSHTILTIAIASIFILLPILTLLLQGRDTVSAAVLPIWQKTLSIALLGDSYSSGNGAGNYYGEPGSFRSKNNWAHRYANWLMNSGIKTTLTNIANSGDKTEDVLREQVDRVSVNTDLVMLTIGGNDVDFAGIIQNCFAGILIKGNICYDRVSQANDGLDEVMLNTEMILESLEGRLSSNAKVVLVGYPLLSSNTDHSVMRCTYYALSGDCASYESYDAAAAVRRLGLSANDKQADLVSRWNLTHDLEVIYVDNISETFAGHEPSPFASSRNSQRWINEFFETEGVTNSSGETESKFSRIMDYWYHPNITGHQKIADQVIAKVGIPSSARIITPNSSDMDVAFVVDTTKSTQFYIDQIRQDLKKSVVYYNGKARTIRFALVDYRQPSSIVVVPSTYSARVQSDFIYDVNDFFGVIDGLQTSDEDSFEASFYSGAAMALDLEWRPGVRKIMVVIGNLPVQNPEPTFGNTWRTIQKKTYAVDPVEVYAVDGEGSDFLDSIGDLVNETGGLSFSNTQDIYGAATEIIDYATNKPFGWIQGPYIVKVGNSIELDARASYAVTGDITDIEWDLDGDNAFEIRSSGLLYEHLFDKEYSGTIGVKITDSEGRVGVGSTQLDVTDDGDSIPRAVDNCPDIANQNQTDFDNDGIGDDCDDEVDYEILISADDPTDTIPNGPTISDDNHNIASKETNATNTNTPTKISFVSSKSNRILLSADRSNTIDNNGNSQLNQSDVVPIEIAKTTDQPSSDMVDENHGFSKLWFVAACIVFGLITLISVILIREAKGSVKP